MHTRAEGAVHIRIASCEEDRQAAQCVRYIAYREQGYVKEHADQLLYDDFDSITQTLIFVAIHRDQVIGTLRLVVDTAAHGLPMDREGYAETLAPFRRAGRTIAEPSKLAILPAYRHLSRSLVLDLQRVLLWAAHRSNVDDLVIAIVPEHRPFYEESLLFEPLSNVRPYPSLGDLTSLAMRLDLTNSRQKYWTKYNGQSLNLYDHFYGGEQDAAASLARECHGRCA